MDKASARRLVEQTFQAEFDKQRFSAFLREILNSYEERSTQFTKASIPDAFKPHVKSAERLGIYKTPDGEILDLLAVRLEADTKLARARTALRNFGAYLLNRDTADAALIAFVSPDDKTWRFSYVRLDLVTAATASGKVAIQKELTPARRLSFLVGEGESCHTAQSRFLSLLTTTTTRPTLAQIEGAFNVEAVTEEFFEEYKELFLRTKESLDALCAKDSALRDELASRDVGTVDLAKKLLGQIVFLYFIQKKGWLGVSEGNVWGSGPTNFLRQLFKAEHVRYTNFFDEVLEPLFYESLATDRGPDAWDKRLKCRIPFLNGGLFEPLHGYDWKNIRILLPNTLFANNEKSSSGDTGTGILDVFDRYNFTVNEAEPLEKEVAIDPEMLGKVFENLLEVRERKSKGSFYTPREIVQWMCQEALINFLDPPVGSNLFASADQSQRVPRHDLEVFIRRGDMVVDWEQARVDGTKSYATLLPSAVVANAAWIDEKLHAIRVCDPAIGSGAFPVGMMAEIVRCRLALNPYLPPDSSRTPYFFKRHAIQSSLYGVDIDAGATDIAKLRLWLSLVVDEDNDDAIRPLPNLDFKIVEADSLQGFPFRTQSLSDVEELKDRLFDTSDADVKALLRERIATRIKQLFSSASKSLGYPISFDYRVFFSEVFGGGGGGFDVVIANPPYVSAWAMESESEGYREVIKARFSNYDFLKGHWDLFVAFVALGHSILTPGGVLTFILPNPVLTEKYASALRRFLLHRVSLEAVVVFDEHNVFKKVSRKTTVLAFRAEAPRSETIPLLGNSEWGTAESAIVRRGEVHRSTWDRPPAYRFDVNSSSDEQALLTKIEGASTPLGNLCYVNVGAQVYSKVSGAFTKSDVVTKVPQGNAKRFFEGEDVQRWMVGWRGLYLDYRRQEMYGPRAEVLFEKPKITIRRYTDANHILAVALEADGFYCDHTVIVAAHYASVAGAGLAAKFKGYAPIPNPPSLEYITAALLSSVVQYYFRCRSATEALQSATSDVYPQAVRALPIPLPDPKLEQDVVKLVIAVSAAARAGDTSGVQEIEEKLDRLLASAYGLSDAELLIVRNRIRVS